MPLCRERCYLEGRTMPLRLERCYLEDGNEPLRRERCYLEDGNEPLCRERRYLEGRNEPLRRERCYLEGRSPSGSSSAPSSSSSACSLPTADDNIALTNQIHHILSDFSTLKQANCSFLCNFAPFLGTNDIIGSDIPNHHLRKDEPTPDKSVGA